MTSGSSRDLKTTERKIYKHKRELVFNKATGMIVRVGRLSVYTNKNEIVYNRIRICRRMRNPIVEL